MRTKPAKKLLFSALTLALFLGGAELLARIVMPHASTLDSFSVQVCGELLARFDEELFWRMPELPPRFDPASGCAKILCLTDSVSVMLAGKGYPELLADEIAKLDPKICAQAVNGGVPGYTSYQGLRFFKRDLLQYGPDVVTVCYGWNDHWQAGNGLPDKEQRPPGRSSWQRLAASSRLVGLGGAWFAGMRQRRYESVGPESTRRVSLGDFEANLREFVRMAKSGSFVLVLMTAPYLSGPPTWLPTHLEYNEAVRKVARETGTVLVDPVDRFVGRRELFLEPEEDQVHYNLEGSRIIARALAAEMVTRQLVRPSP